MPKFPNRTTTPPNGFRYFVKETNKMIGPFNTWLQLKDHLLGHYRAAGYEPPKELYDEVEKFICNEEPEFCGEPPKPGVGERIESMFRETKHTFHGAVQCLRTLVSHRAGSGEKPSLEQMEARAQVCASCPKNTPIQPCSVCSNNTLLGLIKKLVGAKPTSVDKQLHFCEVCHCSNAAKIATKHEAIWSHMRDSQKEALPRAGVNGSQSTCWIVSEFEAKESKYV